MRVRVSVSSTSFVAYRRSAFSVLFRIFVFSGIVCILYCVVNIFVNFSSVVSLFLGVCFVYVAYTASKAFS